ncbi:MAG: 16S rRNA (guanine(527)-N(7))-methyltransferase RsmG [Clostridia bacterium]|nr:16S rRNA (guanine(527)-N(7))-methyltransferase RsmG [Clostridia bacterium]
MDIKEFEEIMIYYLKGLNINLSKIQIKQFYDYMNLLIEWNKVMNLTGIVEPKEIILKHFIDSLTVLDKTDKNDLIIDVGTGAGFPGIPIKIVYPETRVVLLDSLNKRVNFLNEVISKLKLRNIQTIHGRAEDFGRDKNYRERYDIAIARAVAPLNVLLEYLMPFIKIDGKCICMKGSNIEEEINNSKNAITVLGGILIEKKEFKLPDTDINRTIIEIKKEKHISEKYPRKAGTPTKNPL